jgi:hypothetical protein
VSFEVCAIPAPRVLLVLIPIVLLATAFTYPTNVPVTNKVRDTPMMMEVPVATPHGVEWVLVPCE